MKKFLALLLALCLLAAPVLTAQAESEPTYKIAIGLPDSGSSMFSIMSSNVRAFVELTGGEVYFQAGPGSSADAAVAFVENQIAAGADALFFGPPSDSILPTICMLCEEAQVYWGICFRTIQDEEVRAFVESSPYYVGKCYEDEEGTAYDIMADLAEEGIKKVAVILMEKGNSASDQREVGLYRACEDFDMEIVAEARALTQASLALLLGTALAALCSVSRVARALFNPLMSAIKATPVASFVILALVWISARNLSVFTSFLMVLPVVYTNVLKGLRSADEGLIEMARVFGVGVRRRIGAIYAPAALPYFLAACQLSLGICWKAGIAAEVIGQPSNSIGDALYRAKLFLSTDELFAWTLAIIALSVLFEKLALLGIGALQRAWEGR